MVFILRFLWILFSIENLREMSWQGLNEVKRNIYLLNAYGPSETSRS